jgi:serralysin
MTKKSSSAKICFDRIVPTSYNPARTMAHRAALTNYVTALQGKTPGGIRMAPARASFSQHSAALGNVGRLSASDPVTVARMAVINLKKWDNGHTLRCKFLDGDSQQQEKVVKKAKIWESYANVSLDFGDDPESEVRISFQADPGSWSAVGTDCLVTDYFPKFQPTMNFGWLDDDTEDAEYERVVVHEFGHALGCIHEHQSPTEKLKWDKDAVYAAFSGPPNYWSKDDIDHNILQKYSPDGISATRFDPDSIMLYQFDASLFTDHVGTPLNTHLSKQDETMIAQMYPRSGAEAPVEKIA